MSSKTFIDGSTLQSIVSHDNSKRDYREEMILYFYTSMLPYLIRNKEVKIDPCSEPIATEEIFLTNHNFEESKTILHFDEFPLQNEVRVRSEVGTKGKRSIRTPLLKKRRSSKKHSLKDSKLKMRFYRKHRPNAIPWIVDHTRENVRIEFLNKNTYEGTIFCNKLHGEGKYTWSNGTVYEGEFRNNEITGAGRFKFPDQSVYTGEVYKSYRHGNGLLFPSMSPCIYKGEFYLNEKHGFGWQLFSNNNTYEGEWVDDQINGEGCRKYPSGAVYYGNFTMGKRHGYGVAVMKNQDVYSGEWVQGERDGFGDYIWNVQSNNYFAVPVQSCYCGSWVENKRDGIGLINFGMQGGSRYAGYFSNNEKHGSGVIICENGHVIESSPLFINDKPVHVTDTGNIDNSQRSTEELPFAEKQSSNSIYLDLDDLPKYTRQENLLKRFPLDQKLRFAPSSTDRSTFTIFKDSDKIFKQNIYNSDVYNSVFPKIMDQYSSLNVPIGVSCELIDLNAHIYKIIEYKSNIQQYNKTYDLDDDDNYIPHSSSVETYSDYELHSLEERLMRKAISKYLHHLKRIYNLYAKIGCLEDNTSYKPWLMRLFFWQLYRDCKIPQKGISLIDIDLMYSEKSTFYFCVAHNPFEIIYFWQYLESLLNVALTLYGEQFICSNDGVLKQSFERLMETDILPNAGHFTGSALFEYRDVIPVKAAYNWYKSFGEPHSAKQFLAKICKLKKANNRELYKESLDLPYIQIGRNVVKCENKIFYFEEEENTIPIKPIEPKIKTVQYENIEKVNFLATLKPKKIAKMLFAVCPAIKENKDIINFEYKLSFLEFYEIVLLCTQEKIKTQKEYGTLSMKGNGTSIKLMKQKKKVVPVFRKSKKAQG